MSEDFQDLREAAETLLGAPGEYARDRILSALTALSGARAEVERLRDRKKELEGEVEELKHGQRLIEDLRRKGKTENTRLRAALERMREHIKKYAPGAVLLELDDIARQALSPAEEDRDE